MVVGADTEDDVEMELDVDELHDFVKSSNVTI